MSKGSRRPLLTGLGAAAAVTVFLGIAGSSFAATPFTPEGIWYTKGDESIIRVKPCLKVKTAYCGHLVWLKEPKDADGNVKIDKLNPDPAKKNKPMLGTEILVDLKADDDHWTGKAYNPEDGKLYDVTFKVKTDKEPNDQADLRGCILGFLCQTQTFNRAKEVPGGEPNLADAAPVKHHKTPKKEPTAE